MLLMVVGLPLPAQSEPDASTLVGVWKAQRQFDSGPSGDLVIEKTVNGWRADFAGQRLPIEFHPRPTGSLQFMVPDGRSSFQGHLLGDGTILGYWTQPPSVIHGGPMVTPVRLRSLGKDVWEGNVEPVPDRCTFYLVVSRQKDGSVAAYLRNPDRNFGFQFGIRQIVRSENDVELSGSLWDKGAQAMRFHGRFDDARDVLSIVFPEQGGTYDFTREDSPWSGLDPRRRGEHYLYQAPSAVNDGWRVGSLTDANIDQQAIERFVQTIIDTPMDSMSAPEVEAVLMARHGKLVFEEYFHGFGRDTLHDTRSAGKGITAVIVGGAIQARVPIGLQSRVAQVMTHGITPELLGPWKRAMRLEDLLTMRSGLYCNDSDPDAPGNEDVMQQQTAEPDYYRYALRVPMAYAPDSVSLYCSTNPNLALGMVSQASGQFPLFLFDRLVAQPLHIRRYAWGIDGVGHAYGGGGVRITPRDFLKIAQLMLQGGAWNGRRILGRDFVRAATAPLHELNMIQYGYLWWSIEFPYKGRTIRAFFAGGNGGQGVFAVPELDLAFAVFGGNYGDHIGLQVQEELLPNFVLPAVREAGDKPNAPVAPGSWRTPYAHPPVVKPSNMQN